MWLFYFIYLHVRMGKTSGGNKIGNNTYFRNTKKSCGFKTVNIFRIMLYLGDFFTKSLASKVTHTQKNCM